MDAIMAYSVPSDTTPQMYETFIPAFYVRRHVMLFNVDSVHN